MYISLNNTNKDILMIKKRKRQNDPNSGLYTMPGGKLKNIEMGINPAGRLESVIRETEEETGLEVIHPFLRGVILFDNSERIFDDWRNPDNYLVYIFQGKAFRGELKENNEGIPLWVPEIKIPLISKNPGDDKIYQWLKDTRNFMAVIKVKDKDEVIEQKTFIDYFY